MILSIGAADAAPWTPVGNSQLRSDIEILAAAGVLDNITTQWPLPWGGILYRLGQANALDGQPAYVVAAARRVESLGRYETDRDTAHFSVTTDITNGPAVIRGFDALGRQTAQGQGIFDYTWSSTAVHLAVGAQTTSRTDHQILVLDGSYVAQRLGNAGIYAGYMPHWWGPGWNTALSLSTDARPFPQIGITRIDTTAFSTPWLSWMGPWQAEFFIGVLDGKRIARNTLFNGLRISINPLPGLELALARTEQLCGTGHPCVPLAEFFNVKNDPLHNSRSKDETNFDIRYTGIARAIPYEIYMQVMDRDTGPFVHSDSSHLFGASVWIPVSSSAVRLTAEYADTISTQNFFSFGKDFFGTTYTDYKYTDGWQYRGRTLGSSLGTDSRLATLQAAWTGAHGIGYSISYDHAAIGSPQAPAANIVSQAPVTINIGGVAVTLPFKAINVGLALRFQDDQPRPDRGSQAAVEITLQRRL
ncbi:MAG: capsule assembly Wzi family protein [Formivibrio sp.]|nr:capsule assembly Wzi family protein [Formivibrio sp.]